MHSVLLPLSKVLNLLALMLIASVCHAEDWPGAGALTASTPELLKEGYRRLEAGQARTAEAYFQAALAQDPRNLRAHEGLVSAYQKLGEPERAAREADARLVLAPDDAVWRQQWIWVIHDVPARRKEAVSAARAFAESRPRDLKARLFLAEVLSATEGLLAVAIVEYRKAVTLAPTDLRARLDLAQALSWAGQDAEAIVEYRAAVALAPTDREARRGLARTLSLTGFTEDAKAMFDVLIAEDPHDAEALTGRAEIAQWDGDFETASRLLQRALAAVPGDATVAAEEHDLALKASKIHRARWGPTLPLIIGLVSFCTILGYVSRTITVRTYAAVTLYMSFLVGLALLWLFLTAA